jgi:phenol 2-monooxygenase
MNVQSLGLSPKILAEAQRCVHVTTYASSPTSPGEISRVSRKSGIQGLESPMPIQLLYAQSSIEGIFREAMASGERHVPSATFAPLPEASLPACRVRVEQGVQPIEMSVSEDKDDDYPVTVRLQGPDGKAETVRAKYLLGGDGAHSWTRSQVGIDMVGETSGMPIPRKC